MTANPYAELARQRKATDLALTLSRPIDLPAPERRERLAALADSIDTMLLACEQDGCGPKVFEFFRGAERQGGVKRSSPETWAEVARILRAMAGACVDDPFKGL